MNFTWRCSHCAADVNVDVHECPQCGVVRGHSGKESGSGNAEFALPPARADQVSRAEPVLRDQGNVTDAQIAEARAIPVREIQWHTDNIAADVAGVDARKGAIALLRQAAQLGTDEIRTISEAFYHHINRPRWLVDEPTAALLRRLKIDPDMRGLPWPHDVFTLVFERGISAVNGRREMGAGTTELAWIRVAPMRSEMARRFERQLLADARIEMINVRPDEVLVVAGIGPGGDTRITFPMSLADAHADIERKAGTLTDAAVDGIRAVCRKLVASAVLYWAARPTYISTISLGRSQRYKFGSAKQRESLRRIRLPDTLTLHVHGGGGEAQGGKKRPHYRGWVIRTLRDPRYKRNADGTLRCILVAPVAIHGTKETEETLE